MSKQQWDLRYSDDEYVYGTHPNEYLVNCLRNLKPGIILFPAEGEGRNAVFAATLGWQVDAFDQSDAGRKKALKLAASQNVRIDYQPASLEEWQPGNKSYDCICLIFVHLPPEFREAVHLKMISALKPGGLIILEAFAKKQLSQTSGGPKDPEMLYCEAALKQDFASMEIIELAEKQVILNEGSLHKGVAEVVRLFARKKAGDTAR